MAVRRSDPETEQQLEDGLESLGRGVRSRPELGPDPSYRRALRGRLAAAIGAPGMPRTPRMNALVAALTRVMSGA